MKDKKELMMIENSKLSYQFVQKSIEENNLLKASINVQVLLCSCGIGSTTVE